MNGYLNRLALLSGFVEYTLFKNFPLGQSGWFEIYNDNMSFTSAAMGRELMDEELYRFLNSGNWYIWYYYHNNEWVAF